METQLNKEESLSVCCDISTGLIFRPSMSVPVVSPSRGGDVTVYIFNIKQPSLPPPFNSVLVSICLLWPFQRYPILQILQTVLRFLTLYSQPYFSLTGPFNCIYP